MPFMPSEHSSKQTRDVMINIRAKRNQRDLIDRAAESAGKNRSDFMLEAACREAESVLLDQRYFTLSEESFQRFKAALDAPPASNEKLRALLKMKAPWE